MQDVESGSLHQVDEAAYAYINRLKSVDPNREQALLTCREDLDESRVIAARTAPRSGSSGVIKEVTQLIEAGLLFCDANEIDTDSYMKNRKPLVKALCLHIAHECNLSCKYCFAGNGNYSETDRGLMPFAVGKKSLDFLIQSSGDRYNLEVDFFGGEPMLNFDVVKELVTYGRKREREVGKRFRFTLTTNAAIMAEADMNYINAHMDNVVLSLDGRAEVNNRMRMFCNGTGSYDEVAANIKNFVASRGKKSHYVRGTYTAFNKDFAADVLHLADLGFKHVSVEPVVAPPTEDYALSESDLPILFAEYEKLAEELLKRDDVNFFHFSINPKGGPCLAKRVTGCGAGSEYLAVTPSGRLYPCHQFVGDEAFCLGNLETGIVKALDFAACHVNSKSECKKCWAKYYCSGGCMANAFYTNGDIMKPDKLSCELQKKRIECALYLYAVKSERVN